MNEKPVLIELSRINAGYNGELIIIDASFKVRQNDFIGVIGPNGGGKTTLIKVILGLLNPRSGEVKYYFGRERMDNLIGYLPQVHHIDKKFPISVQDVVLSGYLNKNGLIKRSTRKEKLNAELEMEKMGVLHLRKKPIGELSGGQMQRVFLCRAIVSNPKLLILDEPNNNVDNKFESDLYETMRKLNETMAIMIVSHDVGIISTYIKTIICVNRNVHYHNSNIIDDTQLKAYNCPIQLITHGEVPHTVLKLHEHEH
jgi:zinc transport system ATP-binding protein